jgi:hypothetical protein
VCVPCGCRECHPGWLSWVSGSTKVQLEIVLAEYIDHYNDHPPAPVSRSASSSVEAPALRPTSTPDPTQLRKSDRIGGLIHEYELAA